MGQSLYLPNFPENSMWLSEEERRFAQWRLADDAKEFDNTTTVTIKQGLKLALKDYRLYIFVLLGHVALLTQTFQYFFPSIVNTLGYSNIASLLLTAPVWFVTVIVSLTVTYTSGKTGDRSIHIMCLLLISCIGNIIVVCSMGTGARFFAMFLMPMGAVSAEQIILAWIANSFPRPMVKRSAAIAITNMLGNLANVYGPYIYPATDGPRYLPGGSAVAGLCLVVAGLAFTLRL
jgi:cyanate permease